MPIEGSVKCDICLCHVAELELWVQGILESQLATTSEQYHQLQQQTEAKDRNQTDLGALWLNNKRRNNAARLIQRRWRLWRGSNHEARFGRDAEVCS